MRLIEIHVYVSGARQSISTDAVLDVGEMPNTAEGMHATIRRVDGSVIEVRESYEDVIEMLAAASVSRPVLITKESSGT